MISYLPKEPKTALVVFATITSLASLCVHHMFSTSFTYQQYQMSLRLQSHPPSPSFLCLLLFDLLSAPPPLRHCCRVFIHMPAIPECIPANGTSAPACTSARFLSSLLGLRGRMREEKMLMFPWEMHYFWLTLGGVIVSTSAPRVRRSPHHHSGRGIVQIRLFKIPSKSTKLTRHLKHFL